MQDITKVGFLCTFTEGSLGRVSQKLAFIEQISFYRLFYQLSI